ncbi:hypothetical protein OQA88_3768 [Cercophora sp. LCS_1]
MTASHTDSSGSNATGPNDWVMVEKAHTKDREPQFNGDNQSQNELASSSSDKDAAECPGMSHKPQSQGESTESDESIETVPGDGVGLLQEAGTLDFQTSLPLTKDALSIYNKQPAGHACCVPGWLQDAGASFAPFEPYDDSSMDDTILASTMLGSTVSIVSSDGADNGLICPSSPCLREIGSWA